MLAAVNELCNTGVLLIQGNYRAVILIWYVISVSTISRRYSARPRSRETRMYRGWTRQPPGAAGSYLTVFRRRQLSLHYNSRCPCGSPRHTYIRVSATRISELMLVVMVMRCKSMTWLKRDHGCTNGPGGVRSKHATGPIHSRNLGHRNQQHHHSRGCPILELQR